jgi:homoserine kinase
MTAFLTRPVAVSVPATSANLGPGFDSLGLALAHRDRVTARVLAPGTPSTVVVRGEGAGQVPLDGRHLVLSSMGAAFARMGVEPPALDLECDNVIPHARGLGSSSAAIVAGICLARELVGGPAALDDDAALALAAQIEGHPDNVAPALLGGFTIAWTGEGRCRAVVAEVDPRVQVVVFVPPAGVETTVARGLLPDDVPHDDAAANAGRAALLVHALGREPELLLAATEDRLHQDHREPAMPASLTLVRALRTAGVAAVVSGAGPAVLAFTDEPGRAAVVAHAPPRWRALPLSIDRTGARAEPVAGGRLSAEGGFAAGFTAR